MESQGEGGLCVVRERRVQKFKEYTETVVELKTGFCGRHMSKESGY